MRLDAEKGEWKEGHWLFHNVLITRFDDGEFPVLSRVQQQVVDLPERPTDFQVIQKDADVMGYFELKRYIRKLQSEGLGHNTVRRRSPRQDCLSVGQHHPGRDPASHFPSVRTERRHRPGNRGRPGHRFFLLDRLRFGCPGRSGTFPPLLRPGLPTSSSPPLAPFSSRG